MPALLPLGNGTLSPIPICLQVWSMIKWPGSTYFWTYLRLACSAGSRSAFFFNCRGRPFPTVDVAVTEGQFPNVWGRRNASLLSFLLLSDVCLALFSSLVQLLSDYASFVVLRRRHCWAGELTMITTLRNQKSCPISKALEGFHFLWLSHWKVLESVIFSVVFSLPFKLSLKN